MATQGPNSPGTLANVDNSGGTAWTSPSNAASSNDSYATNSLSASVQSDFLVGTNFGFSIPAAAVITGLLVEYERKCDTASTRQDAGTGIGDEADFTPFGYLNCTYEYIPTTDDVWVLGGDGDTGGALFTPADINSTNFGPAYYLNSTGGAAVVSVDHMQVTVYYREVSTSGPTNPGTLATVELYGSTVAWVNPSNASSSNNGYATHTGNGGEQGDALVASNCGFSIPTGATIEGFLVEVERKASSVGPFANGEYINLTKDAGTTPSTGGLDDYTEPPTSDAYISFGGAGQLFGETWTAAEVNASGFGAMYLVGMSSADVGDVVSVDHIRITVYYTPVAGGSVPRIITNQAIKRASFY